MISVPSARTSAGAIPFTAAWVPTGTKAGVATVPCTVLISPRRAAPSVESRRKENARITRAQHARGLAGPGGSWPKQQACISIGVKAVTGFESVGICAFHQLKAAERRDQHK